MADRKTKVFLVGNPNVGKSVIFNQLTGRYTTIANYPGTTITLAKGELELPSGRYEVIDTPGLSLLTSSSDEGEVTRKLLRENEGIVVQIADAKNLLRSLLLTLQLLEGGFRPILVINMCDEAQKIGMKIDAPLLQARLGIPVVTTVAVQGIGMDLLKKRIDTLGVPSLPLPPTRGGEKDSKSLAKSLLQGVVTERQAKDFLLEKMGTWCSHPVWGWFIVAAALELLYLFVGKLGAGMLVDFVENQIFGKTISPGAIWLLDHLLLFSKSQGIQLIHDAFVGPYGLITMGLSYGVAIVLPIVTTFFIAFSLMEDSGYLPRLAVMVDRLFRSIGLNGKAVLPMVLGLGCDTMATLTTRILETRKQRLITTLLLALAVPCSAQLGILLGMFGRMPFWTFGVWLLVIVSVLMLVGFASSRILSGEHQGFLMELPPLRRPKLSNVVKKTLARLEWYIKEAIPLFLLGTFLLFLLDAFHLLESLQKLASPLVVSLLGLPAEAANAFLIGFLRRDYGATGFFDMYHHGELSQVQALVALVVITLFVPCVANVFIVVKEHGLKVALRMVSFIFPFAFFVGGILHWIF